MARRAWTWGRKLLPEDRTSRYLVVGILASLLVHVLVVVSILFTGWLRDPVIAHRGEPLFVDASADSARPPIPVSPGREKPRSIARASAASPAPSRQAPAIPPAPRFAESSPSRPSEGFGAAASPTPPAEEPAYEGRNAQAPSLPRPAGAPASPAPQLSALAQPLDSRVTFVSRPPSPPTGGLAPPGGGGGFPGSQGGVVGQAVPLDTPDPNYREYMQRVRQRIYAKWTYPREAQSRELHGRLVIEFHIGKEGELLSLELVTSSGEAVLDSSALEAVKLAERYPPLPESMRRDVLPVVAIFSYRIRTTQSSTFQLLQ